MKSSLFKAVDRLNLYPLFGRATSNRAAVFMLHHFSTDGEHSEHALSADMLSSFLDYLHSHKHQVLSLRDYVGKLEAREPLRKTVVFTVDDGYADFYNVAYPVFKKFGYSATIFLTSDFIDGRLFPWWNQIEFALGNTRHTSVDLGFVGGGITPIEMPPQRGEVTGRLTEALKRVPNETKLSLIDGLIRQLEVDISGQPKGKYSPLSWEQIKQMAKDGIDYCPHTKTHPILTQISRDQKEIELGEPKKRLEQQLGKPMDIFCYPNGGLLDFDDDTIAVLKSCGYRAAVTGIPGFDDSRSELDLFRLHRYAIPNSLPVFKEIVSGLEAVKEMIRR